MNVDHSTQPTCILLSFSNVYADIARRLAQELSNANLKVYFDSWQDGGGLPSQQAVKQDLTEIDFVVPILTPSGVANTWIGDTWKQKIYDQAIAHNIDVLPVRGEICEIPDYLSRVSFADLRNRNYAFELRRLIARIQDRSGNVAIELPPAEFDLEKPFALPNLPEHPLTLEVAEDFFLLLGNNGAVDHFMNEAIPMMRDGLFYELGVQLPELCLRVDTDRPPLSARILINDIPETELTMGPNDLLVNLTVEQLALQGIIAKPAHNPASDQPCAWISVEQVSKIQTEGLYTWDASEYMVLLLASILRKRAASFLSLETVQGMLTQIEPVFPHLIVETIPKTIPLFILTDVLRRLVVEEVSIRDLRCILMTLAEWGRMEQEPMMLTEYVRAGLKRAIAHRLTRGSNQLVVLLLHPKLEAELQQAIQWTPTGSYVDLQPDRLAAILSAIREPVLSLPKNVQMPVILTVMEIRSAVRRLVAPSMPNVHVVSYQELKPDINIQPVGRIEMDSFKPRRSARVNGIPLWT